jgi:phenylalanyl-tRNA synthetase alpha subunit
MGASGTDHDKDLCPALSELNILRKGSCDRFVHGRFGCFRPQVFKKIGIAEQSAFGRGVDR